MSSESEYRKQAALCLAQASKSRDEQARITWESVAQRWLTMADTAKAAAIPRHDVTAQPQAQQQQQQQPKAKPSEE